MNKYSLNVALRYIYKKNCELLLKPFISAIGIYLHDYKELVKFHIQGKENIHGAKIKVFRENHRILKMEGTTFSPCESGAKKKLGDLCNVMTLVKEAGTF